MRYLILLFALGCQHQTPKPPNPATIADAAEVLAVSADVAELLLSPDVIGADRGACIVSRVVPSAMRAASSGLDHALAAPHIPALHIDLTACGDAAKHPVSDDAGPYVDLLERGVQIASLSLARLERGDQCRAAVASRAVLDWLGAGLVPEVVRELTESEGDMSITVPSRELDLEACEA